MKLGNIKYFVSETKMAMYQKFRNLKEKARKQLENAKKRKIEQNLFSEEGKNTSDSETSQEVKSSIAFTNKDLWDFMKKVDTKLDELLAISKSLRSDISILETKTNKHDVELHATKIFIENYLEQKMGPKPDNFPDKFLAENNEEMETINTALKGKECSDYFVRTFNYDSDASRLTMCIFLYYRRLTLHTQSVTLSTSKHL